MDIEGKSTKASFPPRSLATRGRLSPLRRVDGYFTLSMFPDTVRAGSSDSLPAREVICAKRKSSAHGDRDRRPRVDAVLLVAQVVNAGARLMLDGVFGIRLRFASLERPNPRNERDNTHAR